jgi:hypothetical protein
LIDENTTTLCESVGWRWNDHRLQDATLGDVVGQPVELGLVEDLTRVAGVGIDAGVLQGLSPTSS